MYPETEDFLHDMFSRCSSEPHPVFLTLTAIHPDGDKPTPSRHIPLRDNTALEQAVAQLYEANQQGWGAYLGIAPRRQNLGRWSRGSKADLACLPALFADLDEPDDALLRLGWFDLPASCILHSGRGYHAYWFLKSPTIEFGQADQVLRGLARRLNGDGHLSVAQSMRLPGTSNTKPGRGGKVCNFISYHPERRYLFSELVHILPNILPGTYRRLAWQDYEDYGQGLPPSVIDALTQAVLNRLKGHWRAKAYIAALCPFPHQHDRPGMHFSYHASSGWGHCFGKHGKISPIVLCRLLGVLVHDLDPLWSAATQHVPLRDVLNVDKAHTDNIINISHAFSTTTQKLNSSPVLARSRSTA